MRQPCGSWRRYLWEGQQLNDTAIKNVPEDADFFDRVLIKHRKYIAFLVPFAIMQLDAYLSAAQKKMLFVSIWSSFAVALFILNSQHKRRTYDIIPNFSAWKAIVLIMTGFVGGAFTAFAGSGVDICTFSIITLLFRVSEKTATPTSVVLMGINTMVGVYWRAVWEGNVPPLAWEYAAVSVPVAVTMAPLGSFLGSHLHRQVLAGFIYVLEAASLVGFLLTKPSPILILQGSFIILMAFAFFTFIAQIGQRIIKDVDKELPTMVCETSTDKTQPKTTFDVLEPMEKCNETP
nr:Protein F26A1.8 [Haemonchus contortus]